MKARTLMAFRTSNGIDVPAGTVIEGDESVVADAVALGAADDTPEAVAYAESEGAAVVNVSPVDE